MQFIINVEESEIRAEKIENISYNSSVDQFTMVFYTPKDFIDFGIRYGEYRISADEDNELPTIYLL